MKTIYIPKGETVRYDTLATEHLIVKGPPYGVGWSHGSAPAPAVRR